MSVMKFISKITNFYSTSRSFKLKVVLVDTGALTQAIRNFAKGLEATLTTVLDKTQLPKDLIHLKVCFHKTFSLYLVDFFTIISLHKKGYNSSTSLESSDLIR